MKTLAVVVIGAGIGGITAATHLAQKGFHVQVLEKNPRPGGRCDRFSRDGHHFDTGPTLFVMPLLYEAEFASLGVRMHEVLDFGQTQQGFQHSYQAFCLGTTAFQNFQRLSTDSVIRPPKIECRRPYGPVVGKQFQCF